MLKGFFIYIKKAFTNIGRSDIVIKKLVSLLN